MRKIFIGLAVISIAIIILLGINYFPQTKNGTPDDTGSIISLTSSGKPYASGILNEPIEFKIEVRKIIPYNTSFRLVLPKGVEYISGDFEQKNGELIFEPIGNHEGDGLNLDKNRI